MKKLLQTAMSCLLLACLSTTALANEWGLTGGIYDIVTADDRYEGYTCPVSTADDGNKLLDGRHVNHAILKNRYHSQLIAAWRDEGVWQAETISTTAVYQPGDKRGEYPNTPVLAHTSGGFTLTYGDSETYTFLYEEGAYVLTRAEYKVDPFYSNSFIPHDEGLLFWEAGPGETFIPIGDALWETDDITLAEFNIEQTPRSMMEVRNLVATSHALTEDAPLLTATAAWDGEDNRKLPVYSAPDAASYRSAEGKATVSLGGGMQIFGTAEGWTLIQYEVSPRTSRIGWIEGEFAVNVPLTFASTELVAAADTFLTDDPFVSQFEQAIIPAGTALKGLAKCGEYYAYVEYAKDGQLHRGFIPLKDLNPKADRALGGGALFGDARWDVADALTGKWYAADGAVSGRMILYSNGVYRNHMPGDSTQSKEEGNFRVYDGAEGAYEMYIRTEDNQERRYVLTLNEDGTITLSTGETTQTYRRDEYSTYGNG